MNHTHSLPPRPATGPAAPVPDPVGPGGTSTSIADTDSVLAERCGSAGEYLAGLLAAAQLDTVARPNQLPEDLFSHLDPWDVRQVWDRALAVGYRAGKMASNPQWTTEGLDRMRRALADAGYGQMATQAARSHRTTTPRTHPADPDTHTARGTHP
ncbi:hypothetical protein [Streptomyces sp. NPDC058657]|uniref:hypothetical protein n=1 Tax=unclassified Streptomyces TaxID=2593676 RepID=UPI003658429D